VRGVCAARVFTISVILTLQILFGGHTSDVNVDPYVHHYLLEQLQGNWVFGEQR